MAARSNDQEEEEEIWGTWEELILACLVKRYGPHSWDSVALEIRSRFPSAHRLTPDACRSRYQLLRSRFGDRDLVGDDDDTSDIPWLDELRNLRVAELRNEVQRHDEFIGSLQQKVKKLQEEREVGSRSDTKEEQKERKEIVGDGKSGEDSGRSCNESNNTGRKEEPEKKMDVQAKDNRNKVINESRSGSVNTNPTRNENESSSDVQSLFSRRRKRGGQGSGGDTFSVGKEREESELESQQMTAFLESIQSSKDGLVFKKRLQSQEGEQYKSMIRRHLDLEIIRSRIGTNGHSKSEFFRDLLLLCNNAIVFYPKNSAESISAVRLRTRISNEISAKLHKTPKSSLKSEKGQTPSPQISSQPKPEPALIEKPAKVAPLVACRKRSSISEKPTKQQVKKVEKEGAEKEEKEGVEEEQVTKKSVRSRGLRTSKGRVRSKGGESGSATKKPNPAANLKPEAVEQEVKTGGTKHRGMSFLNRIKNNPSIESEDMKKESESVVKRNVGRPPKRGAKREREEKLAPSPKKRGRR